jgi:Ser-tRNA(Ala) deacylase AlaX
MLREGTCTVLADRRVVTKVLTRDDALALPDIIRTQSNLIPAEEPEIRIVDIVGLDVQADGGTPVASTKQVCGWSRWRARAGRTGYGSDSPTE